MGWAGRCKPYGLGCYMGWTWAWPGQAGGGVDWAGWGCVGWTGKGKLYGLGWSGQAKGGGATHAHDTHLYRLGWAGWAV